MPYDPDPFAIYGLHHYPAAPADMHTRQRLRRGRYWYAPDMGDEERAVVRKTMRKHLWAAQRRMGMYRILYALSRMN